MIGIIGALNEEIDGLTARLTNSSKLQIGGTNFFFGGLNGKKVIVAQSGVGKVNASMTVSFMLAHFPEIKAIINIGVAGGVGENMKQGDLIVSSKLIQHDFTLNSNDVPIGQIPGFDFADFISDPYLVNLAENALINNKLSYRKGIIATGDQFINSDSKSRWLREHLGAVACDMESAAIAHVCYKTGIKFLSMRAVSDSGDNSADMAFLEWLPKAAAINIAFVIGLINEIDFNLL